MTQLINDQGFVADDFTATYAPLDAAEGVEAGATALDVPSDVQPETIPVDGAISMIRVAFPSSADGRGFTIARQLRLRGYTGRLRAHGHVIADQYAMARRSGFDEVEIPDDLAARQTQDQWLARANWQEHNYQARLRG
ncbi:MAG: DUF934 domain-containing protein [Sulfitobacter litoralis]|jgi:uncharacterized protein (DUF934 family)|uniref:DUF934 domain-containing protein n=1 Tax=Sulfitobacter TaxID=60136 RepID=UPI001B499CB0|nr:MULTISPECIES: DUF934 domain-containing protein [Sulfitobacter]MBQ0765729.1 DUF934 domain-containing protein [Sulfitobacter litoralis]MCF7726127.1 DUF934 domain-containing protein [Sulfitobacter sp. M22]MCF7777504.1 DUF934 domain-containing protein [Sulfitobacter sp. M220]